MKINDRIIIPKKLANLIQNAIDYSQTERLIEKIKTTDISNPRRYFQIEVGPWSYEIPSFKLHETESVLFKITTTSSLKVLTALAEKIKYPTVENLNELALDLMKRTYGWTGWTFWGNAKGRAETTPAYVYHGYEGIKTQVFAITEMLESTGKVDLAGNSAVGMKLTKQATDSYTKLKKDYKKSLKTWTSIATISGILKHTDYLTGAYEWGKNLFNETSEERLKGLKWT